ncbi:uncharacterized protein LOC114526104 [Dendronephthya gigantea]|uniref:uncharacterized protein LOC114526104 n=1 Tax=Dendronephthya gigantea TaxID=151771 RepID=UPI00106A29C9|nr:uncharacterized protein LOC114526104 [Dendronephthya gigantea]
MEKAWSKENIICKLADFGESRSIMNQTATLNHTRTKNLERGTLVYNAPEALLISDQTISFSLEELKQSDIWSLGMVLFLLVNPDVEYPYSQEIEECGFESFSEVKDELRKLMEQKKKPRHSVEYDSLRLTQWSKISKAFEACSSFIPSERVSAEEALTIVCPDCESSGEALAVIPAPECLINVNKDPSSSKHGSTISAPECLIDVNKDPSSSKHDSTISAPECLIDVDKDLKEMESIDVAENRDGITEDVHSSSWI